MSTPGFASPAQLARREWARELGITPPLSCPACGLPRVAPIVVELPSPELEHATGRGELICGGCETLGAGLDPTYGGLDCKHTDARLHELSRRQRRDPSSEGKTMKHSRAFRPAGKQVRRLGGRPRDGAGPDLRVATLLLALSLLAAGAAAARSASAAATVDPSRTVVAWGSDPRQTDVPAGLAGVTAIAAGFYHNLALTTEGTVVTWGENFSGQLDVPAGLTGVTAIAAGAGHSLALKDDGTVVAWGGNFDGQTNVPAGLTGVTAIAAGGWHSVALKADGTVVAWGRNFSGETNVPAGLTGVTSISSRVFHILALKKDGTVVGWGNNVYGQATAPAGLTGVTAVAAGGWHSLALKRDGTLVAWGDNAAGQADVPAGLTGVVGIAAGAMHSLAVKADGTVVAWGYNGFGQTDVPAALTRVTAIAAGFYHSLALLGATPQPSASGQGRFGTEGNGQVSFTLSDEAVTFERIRGQRFTFTGQVASVAGSGNTATLRGAGSWSGEGGYTFEVSVVDNARWGRLEDTIEVVIRNLRGAAVFTSLGPQVLKQGDVEVLAGRPL
jgi:hypothetical protein